MGLLMIFAVYIEGLPALFAWLLAGLGLGALQPAGAPSPQPSGSPRSISMPANREL